MWKAVENWIELNKTKKLRKSDFAALDGSTMKKDSDANFGNLVGYVYSNKDKKTVNGFHLYGASIQTKTGRKYILDFVLFF